MGGSSSMLGAGKCSRKTSSFPGEPVTRGKGERSLRERRDVVIVVCFLLELRYEIGFDVARVERGMPVAAGEEGISEGSGEEPRARKRS